MTVLSVSTAFTLHSRERKQWTEKQAWEWEKKVGTIIGLNQPTPVYPGITMEDMLRKASGLGFNSVRFWVSGADAAAQVAHIRMMADTAEKFGMTISPVLSIQESFYRAGGDEEENLKKAEKVIKDIVRPFADDERIALWDIWNEPKMGKDDPETFHQMDWIEKMVHWCREENLCQPITSSIFWDTDRSADVSSPAWKRRCQVEAMMDIHNFHSYDCGRNFGAEIEDMIGRVRRVSNRPLVCTEAMTRVFGSTIQRSLPVFAKEHVHFYVWGLYNGNANWAVKWNRSTYDPYEPMFHDLLWADGDPYDSRELAFIRDFRFWDKGEDLDPGIPVTDRWSHERAWKRMAGNGPVKGVSGISDIEKVPGVYNSVRIKVDFKDYYKKDEAEVENLHSAFGAILEKASGKGLTVLPVLLTDDDLFASPEELGEFVKEFINRYYHNPAIVAWDLYWHPGEKALDRGKVDKTVETVFAYARNIYPNQPVFMTPCVQVEAFPEGFNYHAALIHGVRNGWNKLTYSGVGDVELLYRIWSLSDVTAFSTVQPPAEAGWLLSMCYRFGRPIFCTSFKAESETEQLEMLELFKKSHVYWFTENSIPEKTVSKFRFIPINTKH